MPKWIKRTLIASAALLLGVPIVLVLLAVGTFYAFFYYPNDTSVVAGTIVSSGQARDYLVHVPKGVRRDRPVPLVISLHPAMSWPSSQMALSHWNRVADAEGFIVAYPAGMGDGPKTWFMRGRDKPATMPDVVFVSQLLDKLEKEHPVDAKRVYVDGLSNGGGMAFALSCALPDRIAAVGMVAAARSLPIAWCPSGRPMPMIAFHGTADPVTPYAGGRTPVGPDVFPAVETFTADWARRNGCAPVPVKTRLRPTVTLHDYAGCTNGASVQLYAIEGGGHQWPGGKALPEVLVGPFTAEVDATARTWDFFRRHAL